MSIVWIKDNEIQLIWNYSMHVNVHIAGFLYKSPMDNHWYSLLGSVKYVFHVHFCFLVLITEYGEWGYFVLKCNKAQHLSFSFALPMFCLMWKLK